MQKQKSEDVVLNKAFRERLLSYMTWHYSRVLLCTYLAGAGTMAALIGLIWYLVEG